MSRDESIGRRCALLRVSHMPLRCVLQAQRLAIQPTSAESIVHVWSSGFHKYVAPHFPDYCSFDRSRTQNHHVAKLQEHDSFARQVESFDIIYPSIHSCTRQLPVVCRYLVASSPKTLYVSFIGTKLAKDVLVDANLLHSPLWKTPHSKQVYHA